MNTVRLVGKRFMDVCDVEVEAGTNCPQGGDAGHGGRTIFRLQCDTADIRVSLNSEPEKAPETITIIACGDAEARLLASALEYSARVIRAQIRKRQRARTTPNPYPAMELTRAAER